MKQFIIMMVLGFLPIISTAQKNTNQELIEALLKETPAALKAQNVPGAAIAIIKNGSVMFKKGFGFADVTNQKKVSTTSGFNIGSISKMFTAWGIMKLVEDGKVDLDAPVSKYLKRWNLPTSKYNTNKVTIRGLLSHTAGLNVHGYNGHESKKDLTTLTENLSGITNVDEKVNLVREPESKWDYSGGGYTILQLVIEEVSGTSFEKYMEKTIFKPLKMKNTSFTISKRILRKSAKAYDNKATEIPLRLFTAKAAAGLHTTLEDLIIFANASFSVNPVITRASILQLIQPTELSKGNYGMGYMIMNRFGNFTLSGHGGSNEGWHSGFMLDFASKSGIIILTNGDNGRNVLFGSMKTWAMWHSKK
tara:strand:- start:87230 stop:88318 length:1089 start_codon:yes stop_codon:yes gene_type:complete